MLTTELGECDKVRVDLLEAAGAGAGQLPLDVLAAARGRVPRAEAGVGEEEAARAAVLGPRHQHGGDQEQEAAGPHLMPNISSCLCN